jgi:rhodanese-related sulfurtransferase
MILRRFVVEVSRALYMTELMAGHCPAPDTSGGSLMRFKLCIAVVAALIVACEINAFARPGLKPQDKQEQPAQVEFITAQELKAKIAKNEPVAIVDLRGQSAYQQSDKQIKGSVHTKYRRVAYRLREIPRDREVVTYCSCQSDESAILSARALLAGGFKRVRVLKGGWNAWLQAGGQVEPRH